jgi:phage regulator Rha-like protein
MTVVVSPDATGTTAPRSSADIQTVIERTNGDVAKRREELEDLQRDHAAAYEERDDADAMVELDRASTEVAVAAEKRLDDLARLIRAKTNAIGTLEQELEQHKADLKKAKERELNELRAEADAERPQLKRSLLDSILQLLLAVAAERAPYLRTTAASRELDQLRGVSRYYDAYFDELEHAARLRAFAIADQLGLEVDLEGWRIVGPKARTQDLASTTQLTAADQVEDHVDDHDDDDEGSD